jgi:hypothetical protein
MLIDIIIDFTKKTKKIKKKRKKKRKKIKNDLIREKL